MLEGLNDAQQRAATFGIDGSGDALGHALAVAGDDVDDAAGEAAELGLQPVDEPTVRSYYREDALIWSLYLSMRQVDRFIRRQFLRRQYPYILPERIKR